MTPRSMHWNIHITNRKNFKKKYRQLLSKAHRTIKSTTYRVFDSLNSLTELQLLDEFDVIMRFWWISRSTRFIAKIRVPVRLTTNLRGACKFRQFPVTGGRGASADERFVNQPISQMYVELDSAKYRKIAAHVCRSCARERVRSDANSRLNHRTNRHSTTRRGDGMCGCVCVKSANKTVGNRYRWLWKHTGVTVVWYSPTPPPSKHTNNLTGWGTIFSGCCHLRQDIPRIMFSLHFTEGIYFLVKSYRAIFPKIISPPIRLLLDLEAF